MLKFLEIVSLDHGDFIDDEMFAFPPLGADSLPLSQLDAGGDDSGAGPDPGKGVESGAANLECRHPGTRRDKCLIRGQHPDNLLDEEALACARPACDEHILAGLDALDDPPLLLGHHSTGLSPDFDASSIIIII